MSPGARALLRVALVASATLAGAAFLAACGGKEGVPVPVPAERASPVVVAAEAVLLAVDVRDAKAFARLSATATKAGLEDLAPEAVAGMVGDLHQRFGQRPHRLGAVSDLVGRARPTSEIAVSYAEGEPGLLLSFEQDPRGRWRLVTVSDALVDEPAGRARDEPAPPGK